MPQEIALHGVIVPAAIAWVLAVAIDAASVVARAPGLRFRAVALAIAAAFALSFRARQGWSWSIASAWEWLAPAVVAAALIGAAMPTGSTGRAVIPRRSEPRGTRFRRTIAAPVAATLAGGMVLAWSLRLPGMGEPAWRAAIAVATMALGWTLLLIDRRPMAALLCSSASIGGLAIVILASGFERLTTITACISLTLMTMAALAGAARALQRRTERRRGSAPGPARGAIPLGIGGGAAVAAILVGAASIGFSYAPDAFPRWHWPVALCAPIAALGGGTIAEAFSRWTRRDDRAPRALRGDPGDEGVRGVRGDLREPAPGAASRPALPSIVIVLIAAAVALANALAALLPLVARGEFPPR